MERIFLDLTIVIVLASVLALVFRLLRQPTILAYIVAGVMIGPLGLFGVSDTEVISTFAQIGITLLLFLLGLELRVSDLKNVGKASVLTGIGQIVFTAGIGYVICLLLGFSALSSVYIAVALTFSSTIIVVKLLSDKKDTKSLYGRISVGFLLIQDFVAILALVFLSGFNPGEGDGLSILSFLLVILKAAALFAVIVFLSKSFLPKIVAKISQSQELLFLFSLAWAFGMSALFSSELVGFSIEIGGFLAGLALANSVGNHQIIAKVRPLRDFFVTIFFVALGTELLFSHFASIFLPSVLLSLFVLIGNPLIVIIILGLLGYRSRTSFLAGLTVAQISEFSLIVVFMGNQLGHVSDETVSLVTVVGAVTFVVSTYMIMNGNRLYLFFKPILLRFEKKNARDVRPKIEDLKNHIVLIGANRMGESILEALHKKNERVFVVDFDPDVIDRLNEKKIDCVFGDIVDTDIQEIANIAEAKLVISTVPDVDDNILLLDSLEKINKSAISIVYALDINEAELLYKKGADYVVLPNLAGGRHLAKILVDDNHLELIEEFKKRDLAALT